MREHENEHFTRLSKQDLIEVNSFPRTAMFFPIQTFLHLLRQTLFTTIAIMIMMITGILIMLMIMIITTSR